MLKQRMRRRQENLCELSEVIPKFSRDVSELRIWVRAVPAVRVQSAASQYNSSSNNGSQQTQQPPVGYYRATHGSYQSSTTAGNTYSSGGGGGGLGTQSGTPATIQYPVYQQSHYSTGYKAAKDTAATTSQSGGYGYNQYTPQQHNVIQQYIQQKQSPRFGGGGGGNSMRSKRVGHRAVQPAANESAFYCDICKVSCVTSATYRTHLEGKMHKKKAAGPVPVPAGAPTFICDLCDISCTSKVAYEAHLRGIKHCKVLVIYRKLGKPIPQIKAPEAANTRGGEGGASAAATSASAKQVMHTGLPPVTFVGGHALNSTGPNAAAGEVEDSKPPPGQNTIVVVDTESSGGATGGDGGPVGTVDDAELEEPVGEHLVVAVQKDGKFPYAAFKCTMCDCYFNDVFAKKAHVKGRRHRLNYKKQYQPDLKVQLTKMQKKDQDKRRKMYEQRAGKGDQAPPGGQPGAGGGAKPPMDVDELRRQEQSELAKLRGQRLQPAPVEEPMGYEQEYYRGEWSEPYPPPPVALPLPGPKLPPRNPHDDKLVLNKHSVVFPQEAELEAVKSVTDDVIKALKGISDDLLNEKTKSSGSSEKDESLRNLKGAMPVGSYALNLQLRGEHHSELVLMCAEKPTVSILHTVTDQLKTKLESFTGQTNTYSVTEKPETASVSVSSKVGDYTVNVTVTLTAASMRDDPTPEMLLADQEAGVLDRSCCLNALAALRHAKWFQAMADGLPSCVIVLRVLRDICNRVPAWAVLNGWVLELLVQKCVVSASPDFTKPGDVFRRVMECVASGLFLPGGTSLLDPCEKETVDAASSLTPQERVNLTLSAQHALRLIAYEKLHLVLGVEPLPEWSTQGAKRELSEDVVSDLQAKRAKTEPETEELHNVESQ
ncbi:hypothetical protein EMCRGX_G022227 [Ephydatia muelleri]